MAGTPKSPDRRISREGEVVAELYDSNETPRVDVVEAWVRLVATAANARLDWYYRGGIPQVLHLGDNASYNRALAALRGMGTACGIRLWHAFPRGISVAMRKPAA